MSTEKRVLVKSNLCIGFNHLYNDHQNSDVKFKLQDGSVIAHKFLLMHSSEYFKNLFSSPMKKGNIVEDGKSIVVLDEVDLEVFVSLIRYIYSYPLDLNIQESLSLLKLSNRFQVETLSKDIINSIFPSLTLYEIFTVLNSFEVYGSVDLIDQLIKHPNKLLEELTEDIIKLMVDEDSKANIEKVLLEVLSSDDLNISDEFRIKSFVTHYQDYFDLSSCIRYEFLHLFHKRKDLNQKPRNSYKERSFLTSWRVCHHSVTSQDINPIRPSRYIEYKLTLAGVSDEWKEEEARYLCSTSKGTKTLISRNFGIISNENSYFENNMGQLNIPGDVAPTEPTGVMGFVGPTGVGYTGMIGYTGLRNSQKPDLVNVIVLVVDELLTGEVTDRKLLLLRDCNNHQILAYSNNNIENIIGKIIEITRYEQVVTKSTYGSVVDTKLRLLDFALKTFD